MEEYQNTLLEAIEKDVRSNADLIEEVVNKETDALKNDQILFYREGLKKEIDTYLEGELQDLRSYAAVKSSREKLDTKKKLLELRQKLVNELFEEVKDELNAFVRTPDYRTYLKKNLETITVRETGRFSCREEDVPVVRDILKKKGYDNPVEKGYFAIGGFRYVDEDSRMEFSCLLEEKRQEQREWFKDHSGFRIPESEEIL